MASHNSAFNKQIMFDALRLGSILGVVLAGAFVFLMWGLGVI